MDDILMEPPNFWLGSSTTVSQHFQLPSWELTYSLPSPFGKWMSFSQGGICDCSLQGIYGEDASELLQVHAIAVFGQFGKTHCDKGSSSSIKASSMPFNHLSHPSLMRYTTGIFPSSLEISFQNKLPTWLSIVHVWQYFLGVILDTSIIPISYVLRKMLDDVGIFFFGTFLPAPKVMV